eukprot:604295-Amphidinium_carterae.1
MPRFSLSNVLSFVSSDFWCVVLAACGPCCPLVEASMRITKDEWDPKLDDASNAYTFARICFASGFGRCLE